MSDIPRPKLLGCGPLRVRAASLELFAAAVTRLSPLIIRLLQGTIALCALVAASGYGQRVEFPSTIPGAVSTPPPAATFSAPSLPTFDPYAVPGAATAPPTISPYATTPYAPPATAPYSAAPYGAPPGVTPYGAAPGYPAPGAYGAAPQSGSGWYDGMGWQSGQYVYQNPDGSTVSLQRLLQEFSVEYTWLSGEAHSPREMEINRLELAATFGFPIFANPDTPLLITPGFAFNWLEGPSGPDADMPPRLYDAYLDAAWAPKLTQRLSADLGLRTGVWSDFDVVNSDSVRILGRGLGVFALSPNMDLLAGVWYIDRNRIKLLPAGGVYWHPGNEWDFYLVFPNPKVRKRFLNVSNRQAWWYVAGEYGGGAWTLRRSDGSPDYVDYNDIRVLGGIEWQTQTQARGHIEVGYVFGRELLYSQTPSPGVYTLDETVMLRAGIDF